jgi:nucleotide-binding universal stress UspA family protein
MFTDSSSGIKNGREDYQTPPNSNDHSVPKSNFPTYTKILVPDDGTEASGKALIHAIYLSNLSGAEIVILRVVKSIENLGVTSVGASHYYKVLENEKDIKRNIEEKLAYPMEEKIRKCIEVGSKNKISYQVKVGEVIDEIVNVREETRYDLIVMATSHLDSWLKLLASEASETTGNISTPMLIIN